MGLAWDVAWGSQATPTGAGATSRASPMPGGSHTPALRPHVQGVVGEIRQQPSGLEEPSPAHSATPYVRDWVEKIPAPQPLTTTHVAPMIAPAPVSNTPTDAVTAAQLGALIGALHAPRVEIKPFSGDPLEYARFTRMFQDNVERVLTDNVSRLARLAQLCTGEAAEVVDSCMLLPADEGYPRARRLLEDKYGQTHIIVETWIRKVTQDTKTFELRRYGHQLRSCYEALAAVDALGEMNTLSLGKVVAKLPSYLRTRWRGLANQVREGGRKPNFRDVVEFVEKAVREESCPIFGEPPKDTDSRKDARTTTPRRGGTSSFATSEAQACAICDKGHETEDCGQLKGRSMEEKLKLVRDKTLCFVCLEPGHAARECKSKARCKKQGCNGKHATVLHGATWPKRTTRTAKGQGEHGPSSTTAQKSSASSSFVSLA